jgi:hypothetical protein
MISQEILTVIFIAPAADPHQLTIACERSKLASMQVSSMEFGN